MKAIYCAFFVLVLALLPAGAQIGRENPVTRFSYTLSNGARTSAGVFDSTGALVRTLWSNKPQTAGTYSEAWDGKDDLGAAVASEGTWTIKVLHSNVTYRWEGVIGNTEAAWTSSTDIWDGLGYIPTQLRFAFAHGKLWAATGYSEGLANLLRLDPRNPNAPKAVNAKYASQNVNFIDIDTDGEYLYMANQAVWSGENFVTKFSAVDGSPAAFISGHEIAFPFSWRNIPLNGIAVSPKGLATPNAIAVQKTGSVLAVAYTADDKIQFFNKATGTAYGQALSVPKPKSIGFTSKGLWILSDATIYFVSDPGRTNKLLQPLKGLSMPAYLTTNKINNHVFVLDGGTSQQVKEFDLSDHLVRTYGDLGGYTDWNPTITNKRLLLDNTATKGIPTSTSSWLRVSPENELWLCDGGNAGRILHISATNTYIDQIQFQQETYSVGIGQSLPNRMFRGGIEYEINYAVPLLPGDPDPLRGGNGSWKMVRNWSVGAEGAKGSLPANYQPLAGGSGIINPEILSNGHIYAHIVDGVTHRYSEVELPLSGTAPLRFISTLNVNQGDYPLQTDGSLMKEVTSGKSPNRTITFQKKRLLGFDENNNPIRDDYRDVATVNYNETSEPRFSSGWGVTEPLQRSQSGVYPIFTTGPYALGAPHLGGMIAGRSSFLWKTMREANIKVPDPAGSFPAGTGFGGHNGIATSVVGDNIFASYDGQYASWGNQHYHYWTDGLMIGQFGQEKFIVAGHRPAGSAGNIAATRFVMVAGDIYMYMAVEAGYTPVQRWKISNLSSIAESIGSGKLGTSIQLAP
ncbi:FlgD immunoglobulin-like domain containing protein [Granulicella sp. dw_53]|uniref:FlgD immunoglobulin-like domain containing protein n=1 Tax=Granulicella sp. dw_53 TaxID=2719792 RepID=UPI001BD3D9DA|nr:FlgD immunoglobulin-like domain containing protein [Granulicella sp. dw_53]